MKKPTMLAGRFYLVVEDEYLTAASLVMALEDAGAEIAGPVSNIAEALTLISGSACELDGAVLDINLRGKMSYPVAERLAENRIPFVFVTGYECDSILEPFKAAPCLNKPCNEQELLAILASMPTVQAPH